MCISDGVNITLGVSSLTRLATKFLKENGLLPVRNALIDGCDIRIVYGYLGLVM